MSKMMMNFHAEVFYDLIWQNIQPGNKFILNLKCSLTLIKINGLPKHMLELGQKTECVEVL